MSKAGAPVKTIRFQDHGQDFLEWDLDAKGKVVACRPFQAWLWCKARVTNAETLRRGSLVTYRMGRIERTVRYPLVQARKAAPSGADPSAAVLNSKVVTRGAKLLLAAYRQKESRA